MYCRNNQYHFDMDMEDLVIDYVNNASKKDKNIVLRSGEFGSKNEMTKKESIHYNDYKNAYADYSVCEEVKKGWLPVDLAEEEEEMKIEMEKARDIFSDSAQSLYPYARAVVDEMDYEESPIYRETIEKAVIDDMVEKAYNKAISAMEGETEEGNMLRGEYGGRNDFARTALELLILREIFGGRRPRRRYINRRNCYYSPYMGYCQRWW